MIDPDRLAEELAFAHRLADRACEVSLEYFHRGVETIIKDDDTPVSEADLETDRRMVELIAQERPDDAILSEESGQHGDASRRWIIDPIDGTFNFVERDPMWGNHVALEVDGELVLGIITRPVPEQRWWATAGHGAFRTDGTGAAPRRLSVSTTTDLAAARLCIWSHLDDAQLERWGPVCTVVRPSALDNVLHVVQGDVDAVIETRGRHWDNAPAIVLVTEAGGRYTDPEGGIRPDLAPCRYTNGRLDAALDAFLAG